MVFLLVVMARDPGPGYLCGVAGGRTHPLVQGKTTPARCRRIPVYESGTTRDQLWHTLSGDYGSMTTGPAVNDV